MRSIVIIQARINSTRLPAKVILPIGGIPMVVLAARRAANKGRHVVVATSKEPSDDVLAELLFYSGIQCYRGNLNNTLQRFVDALEGFDDNILVFRLTADNVFPDGSLLDEMEEDFVRRGMIYLCCNGEKSGLPHGMSVELTRAKYLREAATQTSDPFDQEHVTPFLRRSYGDHYFERHKHLNMGHYRCTVDCLDDYLAILHIFSGVVHPDRISAFDLLKHLPGAPNQPQQSKLVKKLVLGTAQIGLMYGIANESGKPEQVTSENLIKTAIANGVLFIDTARSYGNSEEIIGNTLKSGWQGRAKVITKLSPLLECPVQVSTTTVNALVDASIYQSCMALRTQHLDVLMLHRASHLADWAGDVWARLIEHKTGGILKALGVSVQSPEELEKALATPDIEFIQMPFNIFDWRWDGLIAKIREAKQLRKLVIHARSALLQGLLPSTENEHWHKANVKDTAQIQEWLVSQQFSSGCSSITDLCLRYAKSIDWIDGVVVGVETSQQLAENIKIFCRPDLLHEQLLDILANRPLLGKETLNPAFWRK